MITASDVKKILDTNIADDSIIAYITTAGMIIDTAYEGEAVADGYKDEMQKWLTAHLIASTQSYPVTREEADGVAVTYQAMQTGKGLEMTAYGQHVLMMDVKGKLSGIMGKKASMRTVKGV